MQLEFSGAPEIGASRATVWEHLLDPEFVAASAPGVETVQPLGPDHFKVVSGIGFGTMKISFDLDIRLSEIVEPERLRMTARGQGPGSGVEVVSDLTLEELAPGRTRLNWKATSLLTGALAGIGGRFLEGTARRLTEEFWTDFARRVGT
jgi:uncharacterized protein